MVEGPGCKLKGEKLKATESGQTIKGVKGKVVDNKAKKMWNSSSPYHLLLGHTILDVKTLGKELFIILDHKSCIRVHFLMDGFVRYNHKQTDPDEVINHIVSGTDRNKEPDSPHLELTMSGGDLVGFYQCSVELRNTEESLDRWERMITLDICWRMFDPVRAADKILEKSNDERMVCDVIMDQQILPGVGNIIKNEACFDASINPLTKIKDLTREHIVHLVKMNRDFSMIFYNCRKTGKPLNKFMKMYRFTICKECNTKVTKCHPGEYKRGTYFCKKCQNNDIRTGASKNSLLGWAKLGTGGLASWACQVCTLVNKPGSVKCVACGTEKENMTRKRKSGESFQSGGGKKLKQETVNIEDDSKGEVRTVITQKVQGGHTFTFKSFSNNRKGERDSKQGVAGVLRPLANDNSESADGNHTSTAKVKAELCKGHKAPCVKKTVTKEGPNKLRLFWTCSLPKAKSCNHFSWADLDHPRCKHGAISILREVYKLNENNGREFFVCAKSKGSKDQCDFFQWNNTGVDLTPDRGGGGCGGGGRMTR